MDHEPDIRMIFCISDQIFCHHMNRRRRHPQMNRRRLADLDHLSFGDICHGQKALRPYIQRFSGLCQPDLLTSPDKQLHLQFLFQHLHLIT